EGIEGPAPWSLQSRREGVVAQEEIAVGDGVGRKSGGASGGIGRGEWRTLSGGQWRDWQRGVEVTEWRSVEGLAEGGGGH
ncbi:unnamed protein product, partial [Staurois parvus]